MTRCVVGRWGRGGGLYLLTLNARGVAVSMLSAEEDRNDRIAQDGDVGKLKKKCG